MPRKNRKKKVRINILKFIRNLTILVFMGILLVLSITYLPPYILRFYQNFTSFASYLHRVMVNFPGLTRSYLPSMVFYLFGEWPGVFIILLLSTLFIHFLFTSKPSILYLWTISLFISIQGLSGYFHPQYPIFRDPSAWVGYLGFYIFQALAIPWGEWLTLFIYSFLTVIFTFLIIIVIIRKYKNSLKKKEYQQPIIEPKVRKKETRIYKPKKREMVGDYKLPTVDILKTHPIKNEIINRDKMSTTLLETMQSHGIECSIEKILQGPTILRVEVKIEKGTRIKEIKSISDELSVALGVSFIRIEAPLPGKPDMLAIEVPRERRSFVSMKEILQNTDFQNNMYQIPLVLGKEVTGQIVLDDLKNAPHLLVGGATGTGKTICLHSILTGLLYRFTPDNLKIILIDPKRVEFNIYAELPHLYTPVITEISVAIKALKHMTIKMEERFKLLGEKRVRDINGYNKLSDPKDRMPYIIIVIDELADLMMQMPKEAERYIVRLAQKARATGIHLIVATQRPSAEVVTGLIKTNFPSRIALAVPSQIDSRVIIDRPGAEKLLGKGDMLYLTQDVIRPRRIQGAYMDDEEVSLVVESWSKQLKEPPDYWIPEDDNLLEENNFNNFEEDPLFDEICKFIITLDFISVSLLQRRYRLGYGRAARIVDELEARGLVGPLEGNKKRKVLVGKKKDINPFRI